MPDREIVCEPATFVAMDTLPVTLPLAAGSNATVKTEDWPAARIRPEDTPLTLKPGPARVTPEIVRLCPPVLETVTDSESFAQKFATKCET